MKTTYLLIKEGKAFAVCEEIPKEPYLNMIEAYSKHRIDAWEKPLREYSDALQRVKDNAILIRPEDQEKAYKTWYRSYGKGIITNTPKEGELYPLSVEVEIDCGYDLCPGDCQNCKSEKRVARIVEEPEEKPCPNCKETIEICACIRNVCHKCGGPVGNITFTVCDDCWDEKKNDSEVEDQEGLTPEKLTNEWGDDPYAGNPFNWILKHFSITRIKQ